MYKKWLKGLLAVAILVSLSACGKSTNWIGTFGGTSTSGSKVEIVISKKGKVTYERDGILYEGEWTKNENSINLDFDGEVSEQSEPLIVTMSTDQETIRVESKSTSWNADTYYRR